MIFVVAKNGKSTGSADPNDKIFDAAFNSSKIVAEDTKIIMHSGSPNTQVFSVFHGLDFVPLVSAFLKVDGETQAYPPNGSGISIVAPKGGVYTNNVKFNYVEADNTKVYFSITSTTGKKMYIRFLCWEAID